MKYQQNKIKKPYLTLDLSYLVKRIGSASLSTSYMNTWAFLLAGNL